MPSPKYEPLSIRILADRSGAKPVDTGKMAFGDRDLTSDPPKRALLPTSSLNAWRARGIVSTEGSRIVVRSGGPPEDPWRVNADFGIPHMFEHLDAVIFHTSSGDVRYEVVENPDKWPETKLDEPQEPGFGGEVRWYYDLKLVGAAGEEPEA